MKSLTAFLPKEYLTLAEGILEEHFPEDFEIDLNGRTLPWEAAILIPFVDEDSFIAAELSLFTAGMQLSQDEWKRNTIQFVFPSYHFDSNLYKQRRLSTHNTKKVKALISGMEDVDDFTKLEFHSDYEKVGQFSFSSKLLSGVVTPCPDFPSFKWLGVNGLVYTDKYV